MDSQKNHADCISRVILHVDLDSFFATAAQQANPSLRKKPVGIVKAKGKCFINITDTEKLWGNVLSIALDIQERLASEIGDYLSCSVGISHNRLLAKLASTCAKPDGIYYLDKKSVFEALDKADLTDVCGIGSGLYKRLMSIGIGDFKTLRACPFKFLYKHLGPFWSAHLYNLARGIDNSAVIPAHEIP